MSTGVTASPTVISPVSTAAVTDAKPAGTTPDTKASADTAVVSPTAAPASAVDEKAPVVA